MPRVLTDAQVRQFHDTGILSPVRAVSEAEAIDCRRKLEAFERETGAPAVDSIHIKGPEQVLNFHMYGLGLEQLHSREFYDAKQSAWRVFPAHSDIREARPA